MSRTASEENRPDAFCASFVLDTSFAGDGLKLIDQAMTTHQKVMVVPTVVAEMKVWSASRQRRPVIELKIHCSASNGGMHYWTGSVRERSRDSSCSSLVMETAGTGQSIMAELGSWNSA
jgi:hypothetical protein